MLFVRAVITGFGLSLGSALFKKIQKQLGLDEKTGDETINKQDAVTDPNLRTDAPA